MGNLISNNSEQIAFPPIEESVSLETPQAFKRGLRVVRLEPVKFSIESLPPPVKNLADKFTEFREALQNIGISKPSDVSKLKSANFIFVLSGLSQQVGTTTVDLSGARLTANEMANIPEDIIFARTGANNIDLNINISISDQGEPIQKMNVFKNKPINLVLKTGEPAKDITGYVVLLPDGDPEKIAVKNSNSPFLMSIMNSIINKFGSKVELVENESILQQFEYIEDVNNPGLYLADIVTPSKEGWYEIRTLINHQNQYTPSKNINVSFAVDPQGYVYENFGGKEERIKNATVSIFWLNPDTKEYELWPANKYQQINPQITDEAGEYSFLVPPGYYYIKVAHPLYADYAGKPFRVQGGVEVNANIELQTVSWWRDLLNTNKVIITTGATILTLMIILTMITLFIILKLL